jgi:hypothetical protein
MGMGAGGGVVDGLTSAPSFEEFWPHYLAAHQNPINRALHCAGTLSAISAIAAGVITLNPLLVLAAIPIGYGPAWVGHFVFEKNRPATFAHPLWSLRGDFVMLRLTALNVLSTCLRILRLGRI